ncbi:MAG: 4Fe-4S binding protein [Desulfobacterales bacterium]
MKVDTPYHMITDACMACGACASVCPTGHITLDKINSQHTRLKPSSFHPNTTWD